MRAHAASTRWLILAAIGLNEPPPQSVLPRPMIPATRALATRRRPAAISEASRSERQVDGLDHFAAARILDESDETEPLPIPIRGQR
jgi:hypothetical protein